MARVDARADHVGSLLRPRTLLSARAELAAGRLAPPEFKAIEDAAVREVVALQEEAGCPVVTDGELRRESFQAELVAATTGVEGAGLDAWLWGEWHSDELGDKVVARPGEMAVVDRLRRRRPARAAGRGGGARGARGGCGVRARAPARGAKAPPPPPPVFGNLGAPGPPGGAFPG